jgi:hypothetical protein
MSRRDVLDSLDAMRAILIRFDSDGRESMLATIILWFLIQHEDRDAAVDHLMVRVAEIERDTDRSVLQ